MSVHVTGTGAVTPLGGTVESTWAAMRDGRSGIGIIDRFPLDGHSVHISGDVRGFEPLDYFSAPELRRLESVVQYGVAAAVQALDQAGIVAGDASIDLDRVLVVVGTGYGCAATNADAVTVLGERGPGGFGPRHAVYGTHDLIATQIAARYGFRGESIAMSAACASGNVAIGQGKRLIDSGEADIVVVIGADGEVLARDLAVVAGARALTSGFNADPTRASRPFDRGRSGFVLAAGGGAVVLEADASVRARAARSLAVLRGYGSANDAHHVTAPHPEGRGARAAMTKALAVADLPASSVAYVNAHGTSTRLNDEIEAFAIRDVLADADGLLVSSTKSMTGHMIGATAVVEAIACVEALRSGIAPPTLNLDDPEYPFLDLVPHHARAFTGNFALSNSFGFGGHSTCIVLEASDREVA
ncbi:beta-ketoacyl-[acyl-carrier-protein] synthase family protein [Agromyces atrinae]|uniref:beta-ketoacyl-[acyl-carrier-protein] synthase family protein n=1 Tax=Agromyces atrinae TaxID=592376 RepID=UPI001F58AEF7|nr:beta-ketoacyl-[acyl-carrier-protein] synthase family protein [Agromyces atrinae]MCI2957336.1 beta-ketoacyl-[acyl-carrier-protein] synthase family protein [Agromyces atrinae]